jgi:hypothetical protein
MPLLRSPLAYPFLLSWRALSSSMLRRFRRRIVNGTVANEAALIEILAAARDTKVGARFGFCDILGSPDPVARYRERVPLRDYADHADDIEAIASGAADVLFPGRPTMFVATSGTSDDAKILPMTRPQQLRTLQHIALLAPAIRWQAAPELRLNQRSINLMLASSPGNTLPGGVKLGMSSGGGIRQVLRAAPYVWTSPADVFELVDHKAALYLHALFGLQDESVGCIEAVFGTHIVSWVSLLMANKEQLVADIAAGQIRADLDLAPAIRQRLQRTLRPRPGRARVVAAAFAPGEQGILPRLWPELRVLSTVVSGPFAVSLPRLRWFTGDQVRIVGTCFGATEGMVGVNLWPTLHERYVFSAGTAYYEFVPLEAVHAAAPTTVELQAVEPGKAYEVVLTTHAGLYRYRLGDVVRVVDRVADTPVFEFDHRLGDVLDLVGEKTSAWHTQQAIVQSAVEELGSARIISSFALTADAAATPYRYSLYLELLDEVAIEDVDCDALARQFDQRLQRINLSYKTIGRKTQRLGLPEVVLVTAGTFAKLEELQYRDRGGVSRNQLKVPRVLRDPAQIALLEAHARRKANSRRASVSRLRPEKRN